MNLLSVTRRLLPLNLFSASSGTRGGQQCLNFNSTAPLSREGKEVSFEVSPTQISVADDGKSIVCWHPEPSFPYEHSKPIPKLDGKFKEEESHLKLVHRQEADRVLYRHDYSTEELMQLTYTTRKSWIIRSKERKAHLRKPNPPVDRIGI